MENKKIIIALGVLGIVVILISLFLIINYNLQNNNDYLQNYCSSWAARKNIMTPACVGEWIREDGECKWVCDTDEFLIGGCAGVSLEYRQECCDNWAEENNIFKIQCVGEWIINEDNLCSWECFEF